jgi:small subunit ribosomal protein S11
MADKESQSTEVETVVEAAPKPVVKKNKAKRSVPSGQAHIQASFNNTIVSITDPKGNLLVSSSAGSCGFRGSKKGTAYAAQVASEKASQIAKQDFNLSKVDVYVKGIGLGRDSAIRALQNFNIQVEAIFDVTGIPHGGVRPPKARRV